MPRVKIDYVVSFSSEDSENEAKNLLAHDVSKKKWLCKMGDPSCSVVLQLAKAVQITTVHIGACHAALVEVLVGRSEKPNDQFEVLVPSSVFLSPLESRRDSGVERVRSFSGDQLAPARAHRWDRVRAVCSQPYNKHCKYGLSFIHIFEPEDKPDMEPRAESLPVAAAVPARMLALDNFSSDEDDFKPGEMFAKHRTSGQGTSGDTGAQIRQATSQALKNISDSSTKLVKTPIAKASTNRPSQSNDFNANRQRNTLMYTDDDELPNNKIDKVVQRHKDDKEQESKKKEQKQEKKKETPKRDKMDNSSRTFKDFIDDKDKRYDLNDAKKDKDLMPLKKVDDNNQHNNRDDERPGTSHDREKGNKRNDNIQDKESRKGDDDRSKDKDSRKRPHGDAKQKDKELRAGPVSSWPHTLLSGVVFALSGYENPRRARLRDAALAMGARFERDWGPACTHLVCAFPNTPKLKTVRASARNDACIAVLGEWIEQCSQKRRLLPWQWFATEPKKKIAPPENYDDEKTASEETTHRQVPPTNRDRSPRPQTSKDRSPKPHTSKDRSPKPHTSKDRSPKPHTSREKSPKPHTSREKSPKPYASRERSPKPSREKSPKPHTSREKSPKPHTSREKSPKPHTSREKTPSSKNNSLDFSTASTDSDVAFVKDERIQANITLDSDDETDEEKPSVKEKLDKKSLLPDFFEGYTFVIDEVVEEAGFDKKLLSRYVKAYGGVVVDPSLLDSDSVVSFVLSTESGAQCGGQRVRADWVWRCHADKRMCEVAEYTL
ncbi:DNA repair protein XRCC1-like [Choristoneura fumiferana]|uniref:DNA repair protein XRCC1-like n=1 Tax=Choristoneura fumiferana TaxID=7141 RepID=UPI003D15C00B